MSKKSIILHWHYLKKDTVGEINFCVTKFIDIIYEAITTLLSRLKLYSGGAKIGCGLKARGILKVYRFQCSNIIIGNGCRFNSSSRWNVRGLNHACILQTGQVGATIKIGNNCGFSGVSIVADKGVIIGDNVAVGANTLIGDRDDHPERLHTTPQPIHIGQNVFIGMNCMVMKGVSIGDNSIIGAGSIVTKDIPANCVAVGSPCKVIRKLC